MSFNHAITVRDSHFTGSTKAVLLAIAMRMGRDGAEAFPRMSLIAKDAGVSKTTAKKVVWALENCGILKVTRRPNTSSKYDIDLDLLAEQETTPGQEATPKGQAATLQGVGSGLHNIQGNQQGKRTPAAEPARGTMKTEDLLDTLGMGEEEFGDTLNDKDMVDTLNAMPTTNKPTASRPTRHAESLRRNTGLQPGIGYSQNDWSNIWMRNTLGGRVSRAANPRSKLATNASHGINDPWAVLRTPPQLPM